MRSISARALRMGPTARLHAGLAAVAYLPLLLTRPGWVSADTKTYLYLDPGQLLGRALSMWDPSIGMGGVPHQRIGFLWPMGPFYWLAEAAGLPDWVAQRLWWGSIIFAAGAGVAYLLRVLGWTGTGVTAAAFTYALSPVILTLIARLSGVLLPFAGLPWMVAFTVQTVRHRGWRHPALFALTVATFGSVNATGLLLVGVAPVLWLVHAAWGGREATPRQALGAALRIAVPTLAVSAWWIAGLNVQRTHGIEIIRYTETAETVASASVSHEVWRGLGYWFFYGRDRLGPWIEPGYGYTQVAPLMAITWLVPILGLVGAALARWRHRAYFVVLALVGMALAVGAHPWGANPPFGRLLQAFQSTDAGLAMRSLPRAVPLVALSTAVLLGALVTAAVRRRPRLARPAVMGSVLVAVLALPPLWLGQFVPQNLRREERLPEYWEAAADHLEAADDGTRVLVIPGSDFAAYRWGNTVDPVLPGLVDRPSVQRETVPNGTPASAALLNAFDLRLQEHTARPEALAPIARLLRAGDLLVVSDWQYERNSLPEPRRLWELVDGADGLGEPVPFTSREERRSTQRDAPPDLAVVPVEDVAPIVSAQPAAHPLLVAGDAAGLVDAAEAGLIDGAELVRFSATLDEAAVEEALADGAVLLVTDSNRKRGERWNTLRHNRGHTETADEAPLAADLNDNRLPVFPDAGTDTMTVVERRGGVSAGATSYGNDITYVREDRPIMAVDGDPATAWRTAAYSDARGERLEVELDHATTTDRVRLRQPDGDATRHVTRVELRFDGEDPVRADLGAASREGAGQVVTFPARTFRTLSVEIVADSAGDARSWSGHSAVGFAEVEIGAEPNEVDPERDVVRLPTDLLDAAGADSQDHVLAVSLTRQHLDPLDPTMTDEEPALVRAFTLPGPRSFGLAGTARLSARAAPAVLGELVGQPHGGTVPWATASDPPEGLVTATAADAFDGDPATAWETLGGGKGQWLEIELPSPVTLDSLPIEVVADEVHSLPRTVVVEVDGERVATVDLPHVESDAPAGTTVPVDLDLGGEVTGRRFRLTLRRIDARVADDAVYGDPVPPIGIAEVGLPGPTIPARAAQFDTGCRDDLLTVNGEPVGVRVTGTTADALAGRPLAVALCGDDAGGLDLPGGRTHLVAARGDALGLDLDQVVLRSAAGGAASDATGPLVAEAATVDGAGDGDDDGGDGGTAAALGAPSVEVTRSSDAELRLRVQGAEPGRRFWLVLGQSHSDGWAATVHGGSDTRIAARPELVDGFANGWLVTPDTASFEVTLTFTPQATVAKAEWLSLLAGLACVGLALRPARRREARPADARPDAARRNGHGGGNGEASRNGDGSRPGDPLPRPLHVAAALTYRGTRPPVWWVVTAAVAVGGVGWFLAGLPLGLVVGAAAAAGTVHPGARRWILGGAPVALALAAAWVCAMQLVRNPEPGLDWPAQMGAVHPLGWLAALLPVVDLVVATTRRCAHVRCATLDANRTSRPEAGASDDGDGGDDRGSQEAVLVEST